MGSLRKVILKSQAKSFSFFETLTLQFILHLTDIMENISIHSMTGSSPGSKIFCRICHDVDNLQKACKCRGTIALVHLTCLEKWLSYNQNSTCELCGHTFQVVASNRPFKEWIFSNKNEKKYIICDFLSLILLTPLLIFSFSLCLFGSIHYFELEKNTEGNCLMSLAVFIMLLYLLWIYLLFSHHTMEFKEWRKTNKTIKIIPQPIEYV